MASDEEIGSADRDGECATERLREIRALSHAETVEGDKQALAYSFSYNDEHGHGAV